MIPKIAKVIEKDGFQLVVSFDDGISVIYDVLDDINSIPDFEPLKRDPLLFKSFTIDESRTVITWTDRIDLPSDIIREFGTIIK